MSKTVFLVAALLAAAATQATAKDVKKASDVSPATRLTDAQMDMITAGARGGATYHLGVLNPHGRLVPPLGIINQNSPANCAIKLGDSGHFIAPSRDYAAFAIVAH